MAYACSCVYTISLSKMLFDDEEEFSSVLFFFFNRTKQVEYEQSIYFYDCQRGTGAIINGIQTTRYCATEFFFRRFLLFS